MGKGGSAPSQPSTTTQIADIPEWERGYVERLLGQAETISAQPYQAFPGPKIAGFTDDQNQAFSNIEGANQGNILNQLAAMNQANQGANSANNIYGSGAGYVNQATQYNPLAAVAPYLGAASGYNSAAAAQPWLNSAAGYSNQAANAATPAGIQSYLSPYTDQVVKGIENQANQNWNQNIMPGLNDKFVGSGQFASGRNTQVLGQAAGNFQTGLSANVANALEQGWNTAGTQAGNQASILSQLANTSLGGASAASGAQSAQISNLLNQGTAAGTATQQQAANLQSAGTNLGNLQATQTGAQLTAGKTLGDLGTQAANTNLANNQALQAVGQQQQQLNQTNLNQAQQDFNAQVDWPKTQTEYLNQIIRGLPAPVSTTSYSEQTPAYSISPLSAVGGAATSALSLIGQATGSGQKEGGLVEGYAEGGMVEEEDVVPLDLANYEDSTVPIDLAVKKQGADEKTGPLADMEHYLTNESKDDPVSPVERTVPQKMQPNPLKAPDLPTKDSPETFSQQDKLLALARGMLTPTPGGSVAAAYGAGLNNLQEMQYLDRQQGAKQKELNYQHSKDAEELALKKQVVEQGKYSPVKDAMGNIVGVMNTKTGEIVNSNGSGGQGVDNSVTGEAYEEYLKKSDPTRLAKAKSVLEGKTAVTPYSIKSGAGNQMYTDAIRLDPSFDMSVAPKRTATAKSFASGADAKNVTSLNTVMGHISSLQDDMKALNNGGWRPTNYLQNNAQSIKSYPEMTAYKNSVNAVADELTRVFRGTGGSVTEIEEWKKGLSENMTPEEQDSAIKKLAELVDSRLDAMGQTYEKGMGRAIDPTQLLSPKARQAYNKIRGITDDESASDSADVAPPAQSDLIKQAIAAERARRAKQR